MSPEAARKRLLQTRAEIEQQDEATRCDRAPVELDQTSVGRLSRMDALQVQAMAQAGRKRRTIELQRIEAALARIEAGEFGACVRCGEDIPPARLEIDPAIAVCLNCTAD